MAAYYTIRALLLLYSTILRFWGVLNYPFFILIQRSVESFWNRDPLGIKIKNNNNTTSRPSHSHFRTPPPLKSSWTWITPGCMFKLIPTYPPPPYLTWSVPGGKSFAIDQIPDIGERSLEWNDRRRINVSGIFFGIFLNMCPYKNYTWYERL